MSRLQCSPEPGVWYMFDRSRRIAILRVVEIRGRRLLRSVTFDPDPLKRQLIGYFPPDALRLAVECTWSEYIKYTGPPHADSQRGKRVARAAMYSTLSRCEN